MKKIYIFFIILFILFLLLQNNNISSFEKNSKFIHYIDVFPTFSLKKFKQECGNEIVKVGDFTKNKSAHLYPVSTVHVKLSEWFSDAFKNQNKQTRLGFYKNSSSKIALFMFDWVNKNKHYFPKKLQDRLASDKSMYNVRITRGEWEFPSHFDGVDNFMIVLSGNRNVILNHTVQKALKSNDILYFESCIEHHFWCDKGDELNMVLNITFLPNHEAHCLDDFENKYQQQMNRINTHKDVVF